MVHTQRIISLIWFPLYLIVSISIFFWVISPPHNPTVIFDNIEYTIPMEYKNITFISNYTIGNISSLTPDLYEDSVISSMNIQLTPKQVMTAMSRSIDKQLYQLLFIGIVYDIMTLFFLWIQQFTKHKRVKEIYDSLLWCQGYVMIVIIYYVLYLYY